MKTKHLLLILSATLAAAFIGCKSVDTPKGTSAGYSSFRLYRELPSNSAHFANKDDQAHAVIQKEIVSSLKQGGLKETGDDAELIVAYLVLIQDNAASTAIDNYYVNSGSEILSYAHEQVAVKGNYSRDFKAGTLIIDVIDAKERKLIYRNYASKQIAEELEGAAREARIKSVVDEAIAAFLE
ncbi:MAG: DUF4136 domain-containing protein [Coraliomargarita sp.]